MQIKVILFLVCFIFSITFVNAQLECSSSSGNVYRDDFRSEIVDQSFFYSVYLPPCANESGDVYPILYLFHGAFDDDRHWIQLGIIDYLDEAIANGLLPPMIVVMPYGDNLANTNRFDEISWSNVFINELFPRVENDLPIDGRRSHRAIGGISRGGFWAFHIALKYPDLFGVLGGHSAFFDELASPPAHNPLNLARIIPDTNNTQIWLDRGEFDSATEGTELMIDILTERNISHEYIVFDDGYHIDAYWAEHLPTYLAFYASNWFGNDIIESNESVPPSYLLAPVVGNKSIRFSISSEQLQQIQQGEYDPNLIVSDSVATWLTTQNVILHPATRIVANNELWITMSQFQSVGYYTFLPFDQLDMRYRVLWMDDRPIWDQLAQYPFNYIAGIPNFDPSRLTRLTTSGYLQNQLDTTSDPLQHLYNTDVLQIALDNSIQADCGIFPEDVLVPIPACMNITQVDDILRLNPTTIDLAGTRTLDLGYNTYLDTLAYFRLQNVLTIGGGINLQDARRPRTVTHNGNTITWLSCNDVVDLSERENQPTLTDCDLNWLISTIQSLTRQDTTLILLIHDGDILTQTDAIQRADFGSFANSGVDIVLGMGYSVQSYDVQMTPRNEIAFLHYGLGQVNLDATTWNTRYFLFDTHLIYNDTLIGFEVFPGIVDEGQIRLMNENERRTFAYTLFFE